MNYELSVYQTRLSNYVVPTVIRIFVGFYVIILNNIFDINKNYDYFLEIILFYIFSLFSNKNEDNSFKQFPFNKIKQLFQTKKVVQQQQMSSKLDNELGQWLTTMGISDQFNNLDIESGKTVASLLHSINRDCKIQLQDGNSAINRVNNWNNITEYLKQINIKISQEQKSKIINGNHDIVFKIISKLKDIHLRNSKETQINIKEIDPKKQVTNSDSLLQLFLLAIIKHFGLNSKEALSLLSNDSKYLAHILAKGLKGDFKPIDSFITELLKNLSKILTFSKNKQNESFLFRSIKPGLISKSQSVAQGSLLLLSSYLQSIESSIRVPLLRQHLLATLMLVIRRHPHLIDKVVKTTLQLASYSTDFLNEMIELTAKAELNNLLISLWRCYSAAKLQDKFISSSAFDRLISHANESLKDPELALSSLTFFVQLSSSNFSLFGSTSAEAVIGAFREISLRKESDNLVFIHLCCTLIKSAGEEKHPLAPLIFKFLTSKLIASTGTQYETLAFNLAQVIVDIPSIPTLPILEALSQRNQLKISQPQLHLFFQVLSLGAQPKSGVAIYNMVSRALVQQVGLGYQLTNILVQVINAFKQQDIIIDMTAKLVKVCLALYFANIKKLSEKRKPISYKTKLEGEQATSKLKTLEIQYFLTKIVSLKFDQINSNIEPLLCFSYMQILTLNKDNKNFQKNLEKIIAILGDVNQLVRKYQTELAESDLTMKQSKAKQQQQHSPQSQYYDQSSENPSQYMKSKRVKSSHPMSLSLAGVKNDAYSGIQKYVKLHQHRMLADESKRYQAIKAEEDRRALKKAYEKKMMIEKGFKIRNVTDNELQFLFEFDSKEEFAKRENLNLAFYSKETQEDRDANGLDNMLKRYEKALRVYFTSYCGKKQGFVLKSFDQHSQRNGFIHPSAIFHLLSDHGLENFITAKQIQVLARKVNYKLNSIKDDPQLMNFQAFREFIVQLAFTMYTRPPKDLRGHPIAQMLEQLFSNLQLYAKQNRINPQLFAAPQASNYTGQTQAIKVLNDQLLQNPDYILPQGYKKITQTKISYDYKIYLQAMSTNYKEVYEVLDQMLFKAFKFHIIQPFTKEEKITTARPNIYHLERHKLTQTIQLRHIPVSLKKEVAKFPIKDRTTAKEAASALADIVQAIELNHDEINVKHENPILRSKRQEEEQRRRLRQIQERKFANFNRQIKTSMNDYATQRQTEKEKKDKEKQDEANRLRQQKQRKQKRDRELKAKVEEFAQRKKQDEQAKKASEESRIQKEKQEGEKKKKELEQVKRKLQQAKKQKQQEEKQRKEKQKQQEKRKKEEQRKKFEKTQKQKKQMIEEFKARKKGESKVMDQPQPQLAPAESEQKL